ncbi:MAG TPA: hypothetical protein RMH99_29790 [Sandaracinaceae bacterium LLY-WYZ-13_1]|nr:hypothetical protein [Sandaracinaceae bacterium LLY-WYZ-13_1]
MEAPVGASGALEPPGETEADEGGAMPPLEEAWDGADEQADAALPERALVASSPRTLLGEHLGAWLELGLTAGGPESESVTGVTTELGLRYRMADAVVADVSWGLVIARTRVVDEEMVGGSAIAYDRKITRVEPGNPVLRGAFTHPFEDVARLEVGLGVAVPSAARAQAGVDADTLAERRASEVAHRAALAMRGYWSPWRFAPERLGLILPVRLAFALDALTVDAQVVFGVMVPVLGGRGQDADVVVQGAAGVGGRVVGPLHLGARLRAVGAASGVIVPDALVVSAEPWVRLRFDPVQIALRSSLVLNGTDGLGQARGPGFGLFLSGGVEL